jgi:RHS repeat-associated protein
LRDRSVGGSLNERLYAMQDANFNTVAIANATGAVQERYDYTPFGVASYMDPSWESRTMSGYGWTITFQGMWYDEKTRQYLQRMRYYNPTLGEWVTIDPKRFDANDTNLKCFELNSPVSMLDPSGLVGIFFGGTGENENDAPSQTIPFLKIKYEQAKKNGQAKFFEVAGQISYSPPDAVVKAAADFVMKFDVPKGKSAVLSSLSDSKCEQIDIFGLSRGGIYAVLLTQELERRGVARIRFVGLLDPVSTLIFGYSSEGPPIPLSHIVASGFNAVKNPKKEIIYSTVPYLTYERKLDLIQLDLSTRDISGNITEKAYNIQLPKLNWANREQIMRNLRNAKISRHQLMGTDLGVRTDLIKAGGDVGIIW